MQKKTKTPAKNGTRLLLAGGLLVVILAALAYWRWERPSTSVNATFSARRGPLVISVLEGGTIHALESQIIRSEVEGREGTKILSIVEEGYQVTEADVANGKVLVELDSSDLRDRIVSQETDVQASLANYTEQIKFKEVRENRSLSELKNGNLQKKFALMDFKKYLGEKAAEKILEQVNVNEESVDRMIAENQKGTTLGNVRPSDLFTDMNNTSRSPLDGNEPVEPMIQSPIFTDAESLLPDIKDYDVDFSIFAEKENEHLLGNGEASQQLRKFKDDLLIAEAELAIKKKAYEGAERLAKEGYLTPNELQEKKIAYEKSINAFDSAQADLDLFKNYDLQKTAEQYLLNYEQALLELARMKSDAMAELADAFSDVEWGKRHYLREKNHLDDLYDQLSKCIIRAERPGLVVYGDGKDRWDRKIREGASVWRRQAIITIPDMREMALTVKIHESQVKRISTGQKVKINVDAEPDKPLTGIVYKIGLLPDSEDQRFNPDQKVYKTTITIDETNEWLKPGMTAKAEIVVREFADVVYVPLQAVLPHQEGHACFVQTTVGHEFRTVDVLDYNNRYCALQAGLTQGEQVFLHVPKGVDLEQLPLSPLKDNPLETNPATPVAAQVSP